MFSLYAVIVLDFKLIQSAYMDGFIILNTKLLRKSKIHNTFNLNNYTISYKVLYKFFFLLLKLKQFFTGLRDIF